MRQLFLVLSLFIFANVAASEEGASETNANLPGNVIKLHAISSERVRTIMQQLYSVVHEDEFTQPELDDMRKEYMADLVEAVEELLFHSEMLETGLPEPNLDENELVTFRALAGQLYTEALNLQQLADYYDYRVIDSAYKRLNQTCNACHNLFRDR